MVIKEDEKPPVAPPEEYSEQPPMSGGKVKFGMPPMAGGGGGLLRTAVVALVVALVAIVGINFTGSMWVSKTDFTKNLGNVATTISDLQTTVTKNKKAMDDALASSQSTDTINKTINDAISKATTSVNSQITAMDKTVSGYSQKIQDNTTQANSAVAQVSTLNNQISSLKSTGDSLKANYDSLSARVTALEAKATATPTPTPTTTPNNGSGGTQGATSVLGNITLKVTSSSGTIIPQGTYDFAGNTYSVGSITLINGGTGYTSAPTVRFSGGTGSGAIAHCSIFNGSVTGIVLDNGGSGYTTLKPTITFIGGGGNNDATALVDTMLLSTNTIDPTITLKITNGESYDVSNLIFDLYLSADNEIATTNVVSKLKLLGSGVAFRSIYTDSQEFDYETSGNGLSISAGKTKYVYITPSILLKNVYNDGDINFSVTAKLVDYANAS